MTCARVTLFVGSFCALCLVAACSGADADALCERQQECAEKTGASFSVTECKQKNQTTREKADTQGCASEYDDAASCAAGLQLECADFTGDGFGRKLQAECGSKLQAYSRCAGDDLTSVDDPPNRPPGGPRTLDTLCDELAACARKAGTQFSVDECRKSYDDARRTADREGCAAEHARVDDCVANIELEWCADSTGDALGALVRSRCGGPLDEYAACKPK